MNYEDLESEYKKKEKQKKKKAIKVSGKSVFTIKQTIEKKIKKRGK